MGSAALALGLSLAAFYWVPAIVEHRYTYGDVHMQKIFLSHFAPFANFFLPNVLNSKVLQTEGISVQIGLFHVIAIFFSVYLFLRKKLDTNTKKLIAYSLLLIALSLFLMEPLSKPIWEKVSYLRQFQFPWRFLSIVVFASSLLSISFFHFKLMSKKSVYLGIIFLVVVSTAYYWRPGMGYDKIDETYYWNFPLDTTYYGETDLRWSAGSKYSYAPEPVSVVRGEATVSGYQRKTQHRMYTVEAETDATLVDHTQFYPGWKVFVDNNPVEVQFQDQNWRGLLEYSVPSGRHEVRVVFGENKLRLITDIVSVMSLLVFVVSFALWKVRWQHAT